MRPPWPLRSPVAEGGHRGGARPGGALRRREPQRCRRRSGVPDVLPQLRRPCGARHRPGQLGPTPVLRAGARRRRRDRGHDRGDGLVGRGRDRGEGRPADALRQPAERLSDPSGPSDRQRRHGVRLLVEQLERRRPFGARPRERGMGHPRPLELGHHAPGALQQLDAAPVRGVDARRIRPPAPDRLPALRRDRGRRAHVRLQRAGQATSAPRSITTSRRPRPRATRSTSP